MMKSLKFPELPVLLVDDEENALNSMNVILKTDNINNTVSINRSDDVKPYLDSNSASVILLDLIMPGISGFDLLKKVNQDYPYIPIIVVTGESDLKTAIECMKNGAFDYMLKPVNRNQLVKSVRHAINYRELQIEYSDLKDRFFEGRIDHPTAFSSIVTNSDKMRKIFQYIEAIAATNKPVLITGETGVGKELVAKAIHNVSNLSGEMISENISGHNDTMFSDAFFGHKKGAYTGAETDRKGLIESAENGTLFLDEIGDLSMESQIKLLRLLQENVYRTLGSDVLKRANARIIAATNQDLKMLQESNKFRKDLYFRFNTHHIHIPPLRERKDDLPMLLDHFLDKASIELGKRKPTPPPELLTLLSTYSFPGNIRELESMVFNAVSNHKSKKLSMDLFKAAISRDKANTDDSKLSFSSMGIFPTLKEAETHLIAESLKMSNNNVSIAAGILGISRQALSKRLKRTAHHEEPID